MNLFTHVRLAALLSLMVLMMPQDALADPVNGHGTAQTGEPPSQGMSALTARQKEIELLAAAKGRYPQSTEAVRTLLRDGVSPDAANSAGTSALMVAVKEGTPATVDVLLAAGASVNAKAANGDTAITLAISIGRWAIAGSLFEAGADLRESAAGKAILLSMLGNFLPPSASSGQLVIDHGADVNIRRQDGMTPLMLAARSQADQTVDVLLAAGAEANARDERGRTALILAPAWEKLRLGGRMVEGVGKPSSGGLPPPGPSATDPGTAVRLHIIKSLLTAGADVNAAGEDGTTALLAAAALGDVESIDVLVGAGADVNARDREGTTPLMAVAKAGAVAGASSLLAANADLTARNQKGETALSIATDGKRSEMRKLLKGAGAR